MSSSLSLEKLSSDKRLRLSTCCSVGISSHSSVSEKALPWGESDPLHLLILIVIADKNHRSFLHSPGLEWLQSVVVRSGYLFAKSVLGSVTIPHKRFWRSDEGPLHCIVMHSLLLAVHIDGKDILFARFWHRALDLSLDSFLAWKSAHFNQFRKIQEKLKHLK